MIDPPGSEREESRLTTRWLGVPLLFAVGYSAVGFSLYFSLGLVADRGLGLTPLIFLGVGLVFLLNAMTYVEGEAMLPERGGSATFARAAFDNELVSFIAGWAILIDYMIVIALAAISVPHYLTPIWSGFTHAGGEIVTAGVVIALVAGMAIAGFTGLGRTRLLTIVALSGVLLLVAVIVVGAATVFDLERDHGELDSFTSREPRGRDLRGGDRDGGLRRNRGGREPGPGSRPGQGRPATAAHRLDDARAVDLLRGGGDRVDGGAGGVNARRTADGARRRIHRGPGARSGAELRSAVGRERDGGRRRRDRPAWR